MTSGKSQFSSGSYVMLHISSLLLLRSETPPFSEYSRLQKD